jgi:hypothetical protein
MSYLMWTSTCPKPKFFGEVALVSIMAAAPVESNPGQGTAENMSVPSQDLPVNAEAEEPVTHEEATPEVNVPFTVEAEPEPHSTDSTSEDKGLEVEEQNVLLSPESREAADIELKDDIIPPAAAEPGPEVVAAVVVPVLGTFELQAQHSVEETTEVSFAHISSAGSLVNCNKILKEVHIEAASEPEFIVRNEGWSQSAMEVLQANLQLDSTVEPVIAQLEIPEVGESDRAVEVEPQIIPAIIEEIPSRWRRKTPLKMYLRQARRNPKILSNWNQRSTLLRRQEKKLQLSLRWQRKIRSKVKSLFLKLLAKPYQYRKM